MGGPHGIWEARCSVAQHPFRALHDCQRGSTHCVRWLLRERNYDVKYKIIITTIILREH